MGLLIAFSIFYAYFSFDFWNHFFEVTSKPDIQGSLFKNSSYVSKTLYMQKEQKKKMKMSVEVLGVDTSTPRILSGRSTIWTTPPEEQRRRVTSLFKRQPRSSKCVQRHFLLSWFDKKKKKITRPQTASWASSLYSVFKDVSQKEGQRKPRRRLTSSLYIGNSRNTVHCTNTNCITPESKNMWR